MVDVGTLNIAAPGDMPNVEAPSGDKPDGEAPSGDNSNGEAPSGEAPSGDKPDGEAPSGEMPSGDKPDGDAPSGMPGGNGGFGGSSEVTNGTAANTITEDTTISTATYTSDGDDVILNAQQQKLEENILVDSISSLELSMTDNSTFTGAINPDGEGGTVKVTLDDTSTWTLTADSYVTSFAGDLTNVTANGYHLYVNGELAL